MGKKHVPREQPHKEGLSQKEELDTLEASVYSGLHADYIKRLCRTEAIEARKVPTPGGFYYLVKRASLDNYLAVPHKPGPKRREQLPGGEAREGEEQQTEAAA